MSCQKAAEKIPGCQHGQVTIENQDPLINIVTFYWPQDPSNPAEDSNSDIRDAVLDYFEQRMCHLKLDVGRN